MGFASWIHWLTAAVAAQPGANKLADQHNGITVVQRFPQHTPATATLHIACQLVQLGK
jgi:hypothetical protein